MIIKKLIHKIMNMRPIIVKEEVIPNNKQFEGKTAIVIGGGTGIGQAIADNLVEAGARVVVCGRTKHDNDNPNYDSFVWDVSVIDEITLKFHILIQKYGKVDIIVNSQGILLKNEPNRIDVETFDKTIKTTLESVYFINQVGINYFKANGIRGHILNICSTEGLKGCTVPYGISKAGVISLTKGFGKFATDFGITVNGLAPGATATKMMNMDPSVNLRRDYIPTKRACTPKEIAHMALILLSDIGNQMCGEIVIMDGGESLH